MGLDIVIPLLVLVISLLPNLLIVWAVRKARLSLMLGNLSPILAVLALVAAYIGYIAITGNMLRVSLAAAIFGAFASVVAIDYCLARQNFVIKITGILFYFAVLVFCETMIFGIVGHM